MKTVTRYVVRMRNGDYMVQDFDDMHAGRVLVSSTDHPIDATLLKDRKTSERCIADIVSGSTNLLVLYEEDNPPEETVELKITVET